MLLNQFNLHIGKNKKKKEEEKQQKNDSYTIPYEKINFSKNENKIRKKMKQ